MAWKMDGFSEFSTYTIFETGTSLNRGRSFIGNGNFGIVRVGTVIPINNNLIFTSRSSADHFLNYNEKLAGGSVSLSGIVAATISGVLSAEDAYNNFLHNHRTYRTTRGRYKKLIETYPDKNGRLFASYLLSSVGLFIICIIAYMLL